MGRASGVQIPPRPVFGPEGSVGGTGVQKTTKSKGTTSGVEAPPPVHTLAPMNGKATGHTLGVSASDTTRPSVHAPVRANATTHAVEPNGNLTPGSTQAMAALAGNLRKCGNLGLYNGAIVEAKADCSPFRQNEVKNTGCLAISPGTNFVWVRHCYSCSNYFGETYTHGGSGSMTPLCTSDFEPLSQSRYLRILVAGANLADAFHASNCEVEFSGSVLPRSIMTSSIMLRGFQSRLRYLTEKGMPVHCQVMPHVDIVCGIGELANPQFENVEQVSVTRNRITKEKLGAVMGSLRDSKTWDFPLLPQEQSKLQECCIEGELCDARYKDINPKETATRLMESKSRENEGKTKVHVVVSHGRFMQAAFGDTNAYSNLDMVWCPAPGSVDTASRIYWQQSSRPDLYLCDILMRLRARGPTCDLHDLRKMEEDLKHPKLSTVRRPN